MKLAVVAFDDCMTSAVFELADAFMAARRMAFEVGRSDWLHHVVEIATDGARPVAGRGGHRIDPTTSLRDARDSDFIVIPPILADLPITLLRQRRLVRWLATLSPATIVCASWTGVFLLGEAGLLRGRRAIAPGPHAELFARCYGEVGLVAGARLVDDGAVITATSARDLAVCLIDRLGGRALAIATADTLSLELTFGLHDGAPAIQAWRSHSDERVLRVQDWLEANYAAPVGLAEIARAGAMSRRNLARRFSAAVGLTPVQYLRLVRLEAARRRLETESTPVERIAEAVGYADARAFIRAFRLHTGASPARYRKAFRGKARPRA